MQLAQLVLREQAGPERLDRPLVVALGLAQRHLDLADQPAGRCRQQHQPAREHHRLAQIVRDQNGRGVVHRQQVQEQQAQPSDRLLVEGHERLVEQQQAGLDHERPRQRGPARHAERQARGEQLAGRAEADLGEDRAHPIVVLARRRRGRGGHCPRPCARAAGAAPGRRRRGGDPARDRCGRRTSRSSPAIRFRSVVLPQPDGPIRASTSPGATEKATSPSACLAGASPTGGNHFSLMATVSAAVVVSAAIG